MCSWLWHFRAKGVRRQHLQADLAEPETQRGSDLQWFLHETEAVQRSDGRRCEKEAESDELRLRFRRDVKIVIEGKPIRTFTLSLF